MEEVVPGKLLDTYHEWTGHKVKSSKHTVQQMVNEFHEFVVKNDFQVSEEKCEVLIFNFSNTYSFPPNIKIGSSEIIKEVTFSKILGVIIQSDLRWDRNTEYIFSKAANKIWLLRRLRIYISDIEILKDFYIKEIRSLLEYAVPVWYSSITLDQSKHIEKIQKLSISILMNNWTLPYYVKCTLLSLEPLYLRRKELALAFSIRTASNHKHSDFFKRKESQYNTRSRGLYFDQDKSRSKRNYTSTLNSLTRDLNAHIKSKTRS